MKKELDIALCTDFPLCFSERNGDMKNTAMCWGFECSDGWEPSIRKTAEKLEPLIAAAKAKDPEGYEAGYYRTSQLKEKFGTGCWYLSGGTDEMQDLVQAWENETENICEICGKPGKLHGQGWYYTSCFEHTKEQDRDSLEIVEKASEEKERTNEN